jgi:hypothetical protein
MLQGVHFGISLYNLRYFFFVFPISHNLYPSLSHSFLHLLCFLFSSSSTCPSLIMLVLNTNRMPYILQYWASTFGSYTSLFHLCRHASVKRNHSFTRSAYLCIPSPLTSFSTYLLPYTLALPSINPPCPSININSEFHLRPSIALSL